MTIYRIALIIVSTLIIAACGGGGSKPTPSPTPSAIPSSTPPPVVVENKTFGVKVSEVSARRRTNGAPVEVDTSELNVSHTQQK